MLEEKRTYSSSFKVTHGSQSQLQDILKRISGVLMTKSYIANVGA